MPSTRTAVPSAPTPSLALTAALVAVVALTMSLVGLAASPAQAHNVLRSSDPADGATVPAPTEVMLTFDQSVQTLGTAVAVEGPKGELTLEPLTVDGQTVVQPLPERLVSGDYTVLWRATSADGHPIDGTFSFTATDPEPEPTGSGPTSAAPPPPNPSDTAAPSSTVTTPPPTTTEAATTAPGATATTTDVDAAPASSDSDAGSSLPLWIGLGLIALALAGAAVWAVRRRQVTDS